MKKIILSNLLLVISFFVFAQKEKLPVIKSPVFKKDTLNIKKFGASTGWEFFKYPINQWCH
jgi:hypothetical protein